MTRPSSLEIFFGDKWKAYLDDLLKHVEFELENEKEYDDISEPFRQMTYRIHTKNQPTREEYDKAESLYKARLKKALDSFCPAYITSKILSLHTLADCVSCAPNLRSVVLAYKEADEATQKAELYVGRAHAIADAQTQLAIDRDKGK